MNGSARACQCAVLLPRPLLYSVCSCQHFELVDDACAPPPPPPAPPAESGARDTFNYVLLPAMTYGQADTLLARHFYYRQHPGASKDVPPPEAAVEKIKADYASSIAFLIGALGTRGRWLRLLVDNKGLPKPDSELRTRGVPVPGELSRGLPRVVLPVSPLPVSCCAGGRWLTAQSSPVCPSLAIFPLPADTLLPLLPADLPVEAARKLHKAAADGTPAPLLVDGEWAILRVRRW